MSPAYLRKFVQFRFLVVITTLRESCLSSHPILGLACSRELYSVLLVIRVYF